MFDDFDAGVIFGVCLGVSGCIATYLGVLL